MSGQRIRTLLQDLVTASASERNRAKALRWGQSPLADKISGLRDAPPPALLAEILPSLPTDYEPSIPYTVDPQLAMYARILPFSLVDYYQDLESFLVSDLALRLYRFENFDDDAYLSPTIRLSYAFAPVLEISIYGMTPQYAPDSTPWCEGEPIIIEESDLDRLPRLDFDNSGLMPQVHRWYQETRKIVAGLPVSVDFPGYVISIFGLALRLRGYEQLLVDMFDRPDFVHRLMRRLVEDRNDWEAARNRFLGLLGQPIALGNDDIGSPTLSPRLYQEFVWPYEVELARRYGGVAYWHSCNYTDKLLAWVKDIPGLQVFHVGPWNNVRQNIETLGDGLGYEVCLNPETILSSSEDETRAALADLVSTTRGKPVTLRADCFQARHDLKRDLALIKRWAKLAREITA